MHFDENVFLSLRESLEGYSPISDDTWLEFKKISKLRSLTKKSLLYKVGDVPSSFSYVYSGLVRCFSCDAKGNEYNKNFFDEGKFPGAMTALLTSTPSAFTFEAVEDTFIIEIDFPAYRQLMIDKDDLKLFQIYYLEENWLLAKDARETEIVQEETTERYLRFINQYPSLVDRLPQYHIASHLGITPTQLSRIRKNM